MEYVKQLEFFSKYDYFTLDSLLLLLGNNTNPELAKTKIAIYSTKLSKYKDIMEEFEGINEYDDISRVLNFDIEEVKEDIVNLNKEELELLALIFSEAKKKIIAGDLLLKKIFPQVEKFSHKLSRI